MPVRTELPKQLKRWMLGLVFVFTEPDLANESVRPMH